MSLVSRLSSLKTLPAPIQMGEYLPLFWIRKYGPEAVALFESLRDFEEFHSTVPVFHGFEDCIELDEFGTIRIYLGYLQ